MLRLAVTQSHQLFKPIRTGCFPSILPHTPQPKRCNGSHTLSRPEGIGAGGGRRSTDTEKQRITPLGWFLLLIPVTTFGLGCWQLRRKAWKEQLIKEMEQLAKTAPAPLPDNLADVAHLEYRLVKVRGRFLHEKEMLLGPRSLIRPPHEAGADGGGGLFSQRDSGNGYLIVTPFLLEDRNEMILVNRGWVSRKQTKPSTRLAGQTNSIVELTGVVRCGEQRPQFSPAQRNPSAGGDDIFLYRDLARMCALSGAEPVFLDATYESSVPGGPVGGQTRVTLRNEHLSYLITWYSLSVATSFLWYRSIYRRVPF